LVQIRQKLAAGEISRMHQVKFNGNWISVGEFVDARRAEETRRANTEAHAKEQQIRRAYEEELEKARSKEAALAEQLRIMESSKIREEPPASPQSAATQFASNQQQHSARTSRIALGETLGQVRCIRGPDQGLIADLGSGAIRFGTGSGCGLASRDPSVASEHVALRIAEGRLCVIRRSPSGVVMLNGVPLGQSEWLRNGEQFQMGSSLWEFESFTLESSAQTGGLADTISSIVGVQSIGGFNFSETFAHVFKAHSDEETELNLACGTTATTPTIEQISPAFPQPWMFVRTFGLSLLAFRLLEFTAGVGDIPALIALGSVATPLSLLILFFEVNKPRNISTYQLLKLLIIGGILSFIFLQNLQPLIVSFLTSLLKLAPGNISDATWIAGFSEEPAKLLVLYWMVNKPRYCWTLNGMLFGAAVGAGFAIFETAGYAFEYLLQSDDVNVMYHVLFVRGLSSAFSTHTVWSAIAGAGLWRAKRGRPFTFNLLLSRSFLGPFLAAVGMHALWNSPFQFYGIPIFSDIKYVFIGFVGWVIVIGLIREGLREIVVARRQLTDPST
jgi:RsiW-degrading membrane proteinase PrsW (M82 family)